MNFSPGNCQESGNSSGAGHTVGVVSRWRPLLLAGLTVVAYLGLHPAWTLKVAGAETGGEEYLERYAAYGPSYRVVRDLLTSLGRDHAYEEFYVFLKSNTNMAITPSQPPPNLEPVKDFQPTTGKKPNIFLLVMDSLRQDYLSPYNPAVTFTPAIEEFARESVVMRRAFTRYGGTALAEPSIWTGSLLQHMLYAQPFYPLNSLQKLVERDGYESYITVDPGFRSILRFSLAVIELDQDASYWTDFDVCGTARELQHRLDRRPDKSKPVFFYTLAQNLHMVSLYRNQKAQEVRKPYPGFQPVYASQVEVVDACFSDFIRYLKERGLYDNSIVILTADHGDSFGEYGYLGHSHGLFPEILRIPLIIHLPAVLQKSLSWDTDEIAFSTDITPSLYYLLGHRPIQKNAVLGRPLFTETAEERRVASSHLVVSSYGPVYGVLHDKGERLFVVNALARTSFLFDLTKDSRTFPQVATAPERRRYQAFIQSRVEAINKFYAAPPPQQ